MKVVQVPGSTVAVPLSGKFTHVPLLPSSTIGNGQWAVIPYGWEGNRRSAVALTMYHRLQRFIHLRPSKGDEHRGLRCATVLVGFTLARRCI